MRKSSSFRKGQLFITSRRGAEFEKAPKGQFFIISAIILVASLMSIQYLFSGYSDFDASENFQVDGDYIYFTTKSAFTRIIQSQPCPELGRSLAELETQWESAVRSRGFDFEVTYTAPCAGSVKNTVTVKITVKSADYQVSDSFTV